MLTSSITKAAIVEHIKVQPVWLMDEHEWTTLLQPTALPKYKQAASLKPGVDFPVINYHNWHLFAPQPALHEVRVELFWNSDSKLAATLASSQHLITALDSWQGQTVTVSTPFPEANDSFWKNELHRVTNIPSPIKSKTMKAFQEWLTVGECRLDKLDEILAKHGIRKQGDEGSGGAWGVKPHSTSAGTWWSTTPTYTHTASSSSASTSRQPYSSQYRTPSGSHRLHSHK